MDAGTDKPFDLHHYRRMLWRRRGLILLCMVGVLCATTIGMAFIPPQYQSEVTLLIEERQPLSAQLEQVLGGTRTTAGGTREEEEERLTRMIGRIRSRPFLERVIKILKMNEDPIVRAEAKKRASSHPELSQDELAVRLLVSSLQRQIQFGTVGPGLYKIVIVDTKAENAQLLAKWVSELFVDVSIQKELEHIRTVHQFGEEQLRVYQEQLQHSEEALERYKGSLIQQNLAVNVVRDGNLGTADLLSQRLRDDLLTTQARVLPLSRAAQAAGMASGDVRLRDDPEVQALSRRISTALSSGAQDLLSAVVPDVKQWPPKGDIDVERRDLYLVIEKRAGVLYPGSPQESIHAIASYVFAQVDAAALADAADWLDRNINAFKHHAQTGPADEMEVGRLEDEVKRNRDLLQSFQAQAVASDVSQAVETTNLGLRMEIIDPAQLPLAPTRPNRSRIFMASIFVGPLIGVGFAFLGELLDPTLRTLDGIRRIAPEPIYGVLPRFSALRPRKRGLRRYWVPAALGGIVLLTALFFVARVTVLRDLTVAGSPLHLVDPGDQATP
jgi:protein tyrosine kinase modulator